MKKLKCPRCKSKEMIKDVCKKCSPQEYWKLHQEQNTNRLGDWV